MCIAMCIPSDGYGDRMVKSREHGQGALYWDASKGLWRAVVDVGFDPRTGKRMQKARTSKSKDTAMKKLNAMIRERDTLGRVIDHSMRVRELANTWLEDVGRRAKPKTIAGYRSNVKSKIVPALGTRVVSMLTPADIRRLHSSIRETGAGDASVASAHRTLVTMLEYARGERLVVENVAQTTPPRKARPTRARQSLTRDEAKALLAQEDPRWSLGLLTGLRSGEACALRWEDIDLDVGIAAVSWSLTEATFAHGCGGTCGRNRAGACPERRIEVSDELEWIPLQGRHLLVRPKNDQPREIPLTLSIVKQLTSLKRADGERNPHGLVWHSPDGSPRTNSADNRHLRAVVRAAGIDRPEATTHWLRHSYVTLSEHAGIPWAASSGVSGHSTPESTDPYRHVLTDEGRRAVKTLSEWVEAPSRSDRP